MPRGLIPSFAHRAWWNIWMEGSVRPGQPTGDQGFVLSPDGRRIAFLTGKDAFEVWALENFLPAASAKR